MKYQLSLKTAAAYGRLLDFVPVYQRDDFKKNFEEFLATYDADNETEKTAPAPALETVDKQRTIPKVGEIYKDTFSGVRFEVLAVIADSVVITKSITALPQNETVQIGTLEKFQRLNLTKED